MDAKGCEVMAVSSAFVDDGAHNALRASSARRDQLCLAGEVIARSRCVWALSRSHQPVGDCGRTPSPNAELVIGCVQNKADRDEKYSVRKSNSHIQMMKSAKKWRRQNATNGMYCSRRRRVLVD